MSEQLSLAGTTQDEGLTLVQREIAEEQRRIGGRVSADEAGAIVHELRGRHSRSERCLHCARDGRDVLRLLVEKHREAVPYNEMPAGF